MSKYDKLLFQILRGTADSNVSFDDQCGQLEKIGFEKRIRRSHHMFRKEAVVEKINLQRDGNKAKVYQVRQVRAVLLKYKLGGDL
jgi:hypothetical protein